MVITNNDFGIDTTPVATTVVYLSSGYTTLKAKRIQHEDGLKRAETCSCVTYCTSQYNKLCCVLTDSYIFCI